MDAAKELDVDWKKPYWKTGCPFREVMRWILYQLGVKSVKGNDTLSALMAIFYIFAIILNPFRAAAAVDGFCNSAKAFGGAAILSIIVSMLTTIIGYWVLYDTGEKLHGDPFAEGGDLYIKD